jgi:hypothetical protein
MQRGEPHIAPAQDIRPLLDKRLDGVGVPLASSNVQRRVVVDQDGRDGRAMVDEEAHDGLAVAHRGRVQHCPSLRRLAANVGAVRNEQADDSFVAVLRRRVETVGSLAIPRRGRINAPAQKGSHRFFIAFEGCFEQLVL